MSLRAQNKQKARRNILQAATQLIAQQGVEATTTREIAVAAGVSYQTLYNYFPTKALIIREILTEEFETWNHEVDQEIKQYDGDLFRTLQHIHKQATLLMLGDKYELWKALTLSVLTQQAAEEDQAQDESLATLVAITHERYYNLLALAQGMGHLQKECDLHLLAHTLFAVADHAFLMVFVVHADVDAMLATLDGQMRLIVTPYLTNT